MNRLDAGLRRLVATNLIGILFVDLSGKILEVDESFLHTLGYARADLPVRIHDLTTPEDRRLDDEAFEKLMAFGACAPFEKNLVRHDGSLVPVLFGAALYEDEIACFVVDLSQNKRIEVELTCHFKHVSSNSGGHYKFVLIWHNGR